MALKQIVALGITGPARVGKDTVAKMVKEVLETKYNYSVVIKPLASELKNECAKTLGIDRVKFDDPQFKEHLRPLMQWWGTEYRRNEILGGYDMYWCDVVANNLANATVDIVIVSDVRFDNEANWIFDTFGSGIVLAIESGDFKTTTHTKHASEQGVSADLISMGFQNSHSAGLESLVPKVDWVASRVHEEYEGLWNDPCPTDEQMFGMYGTGI